MRRLQRRLDTHLVLGSLPFGMQQQMQRVRLDTHLVLGSLPLDHLFIVLLILPHLVIGWSNSGWTVTSQ